MTISKKQVKSKKDSLTERFRSAKAAFCCVKKPCFKAFYAVLPDSFHQRKDDMRHAPDPLCKKSANIRHVCQNPSCSTITSGLIGSERPIRPCSFYAEYSTS